MFSRGFALCGAVFVLGWLVKPELAQCASWGVIASTYDTLRETPVVIEGTLQEALQEAVQSCRRDNPGQDCFAVAAVMDGCVTWAVDRRGHYAWAQSLGPRPGPEALLALEKKALDQCRQAPNSRRCRIARTICTDD